MFSFPGIRLLIGESLAVATVVSGLVSLLASNQLYTFITLTIAILLSQVVSTEITFQIAPNKKLLDRRRSFGLAFASSILMLPALLIAFVGLVSTNKLTAVPLATITISASLATYLRYLSCFMYIEISRGSALLMALSQPLPLIFAASVANAQILNRTSPIITSVVLGFLLAEITIYILKSRVSGERGLDGLALSRAFFAGWMGGEPEKIEKVLEVESTREDLNVDVFGVKTKQGGRLKTVLVAPSIHAGPFRNIGSSNLPAVIGKKIAAEFQVPTLVFHGAVSHERDLVHSRDLNFVAEEIAQKLRDTPSVDFNHGSMITRTRPGMVGGLGFDQQQLLWISLAPLLSEDLPQRMQLDAEAYALKRGVRKIRILDTHSCLSREEPSPDVMKLLEEQVDQVVDQLAEKEPSGLELGVARVDTVGFSKDEIAGLQGAAAFLRVANDSMGILLFDSNNMTRETRQLLDNELPKALGAPVEVFTTDTHVLVGIRVRKDYSPLGERTERELIVNHSIDALRRAKSDLESVTISSVTVGVKGMAILGEKGIETFGHAADAMVNMARRLLPITTFACALLSLLSIYLLP